jgi:hypothetical protein
MESVAKLLKLDGSSPFAHHHSEVGEIPIKLRSAPDHGVAGRAQPLLVGPIGIMEPIDVGDLGGRG